MERTKRAQLYKEKSDEAMQAAQLCFKNSLFRAACNRAWYATMQIITAGIYLETEMRPPTEQPNFSHTSQPRNFELLIRVCRRTSEYSHLIPYIRNAMDHRNYADYGTEKELRPQAVKSSLLTAEQVRDAVYKMVGADW